MLKLREVEDAIAEVEGMKNPNAATCAKLADLYTIRANMLGEPESYARSYPVISAKLELYGNSDFLIALEGKDAESAWNIIDELMETLKLTFPRAYDRVMRKIYDLEY